MVINFFFLILLVVTIIFLFYPVYLTYDSENNYFVLLFFQFIPIYFPIKNFFTINNNDRKKTMPLFFNKNFISIVRILKTFEIVELKLKLNLDDNQINGIIYPMFFLVKRFFKKDIQISFYEESCIKISAKNNLARLSWAIISSK